MRTDTGARSRTVKKMFNQETSKEVASELLQSYQQTLSNLAQKMLLRDVRTGNFSRDEKTPKLSGKTKTHKQNRVCRIG